MRAAKVQASLRIRAVSPEPSLLAHTSSESRGTFRQKARSIAPLNGWACAVEICHDGMLKDTNSLDGAQLIMTSQSFVNQNHTELRFCFWNIGGLHYKMEDESFLSNIKHYDIVLLAETHIGYDKNVAIEGFHYFPICRAKSANGRYYGGLAILT